MSREAQFKLVLSATDKMSKIVSDATGRAMTKFEHLEKRMASIKKTAGAVASSAGMVGAAIGGALFFPVQEAREFEAAIVRTKAISKATEAQFEALTASARKMGKTTAFSATQAANAQEFLAMAGMKVEEITAALPDVLNLATVGNIGLAESANIVSNIMSGFGFQAEKTGEVVDVMANAITSANLDVAMMGETMKVVGPIAKSMGVDFKTTTAFAGKLADAGVQGSEAGTAFRSILLSLGDVSGKTGKMLKKLGIQVEDELTGSLKDPTVLFDELQKSIGHLSSVKQMDILKGLFGKEPASGVAILMDAIQKGDKGGVADLRKKLDEVGTASRISEQMLATFDGQMKIFNSSVSDLGITLGTMLLPSLNKVFGFIGTYVTKISEWAERNERLSSTIMTVLAVLGTVASVMSVAGFAVAGLATAFGALNIAMGPIWWAVIGIIVVITALWKNWDAIMEFMTNAWSSFMVEFDASVSKFNVWIDGMIDSFKSLGEGIYEWAIKPIMDRFNELVNFIGDTATAISDKFKSALGIASPSKVFIKHGEAIAEGAKIGVQKGGIDEATDGVTSGLSSPNTTNNNASNSVSINYSPTINLGGQSSVMDIESILRGHEKQLAEMVRKEFSRSQKLAF